MTSLLDKAIEQASRLPADQQDELAQIILDELASEARWDRAFGETEGGLSRLAADALAEHRRGETRPLDAETLCGIT